jgi:O-antigen/teichoic acid export membrane protein
MSENKIQESFIDNKNHKTDLKRQSLRGGTITLASQGILFLINIGSTMILARLLTPQDYGLITMVAAITTFAGVFIELGLSTATIQQNEINQSQLSNLFWINVGLGIIITFIVAATSPAIAWFYKEPKLVRVTLALSLNFFMSGLVVQHNALLTRRMRFGMIAKVRITSTIFGVIVAVLMAKLGERYWALVFKTLVSSACSVVLFVWVTKWWPSMPKINSSVGSMLRFGSHIAGFNLINYFHRNFDNILIGKFSGPQQLGLYSKAYSLLMFPISNLRIPLNRVALPVMSKLQNDPQKFRSYYSKYSLMLSFISMPIVTFLFISSKNVILLILGDQWLGAVDLFSILALAAFIQPVSTLRGLVLVSLGMGSRYFRWGLYNAFFTVVSFLCGIPWGAKGVAISYCIGIYIILHPSLIYTFKNTPLKPFDFYRSIWKPFVASFLTGVVCYFFKYQFHGIANIYQLFILGICCAITYTIILIIIPGGWALLKDFFGYFLIVLKRDKQDQLF